MGQKKLQRFAELETMPNVLQFPGEMKGNWHSFFNNANPIILELACGKGEYAVGLGALYPQKNFIGIDVKGNRIWVGAKKAQDQQLKNVAFLRTEIDQIDQYFNENEVKEIWITFPDPQLRLSKAKKRLTHPKFLRLYQKFLVPGGRIHLKTDSPVLYDFTHMVIDLYNCSVQYDSNDIYSDPGISEELRIKTHYESLDISESKRVHYLCFSLPSELPAREQDELLKEKLKLRDTAVIEMDDLKEGIDYYINEEGYIVLTEKYHLEKGFCCGNGCKHCPYEYGNVPEPQRTTLLKEKMKS